MSYAHKELEGVDYIELADEVDLYSTPELKKFCRELLNEGNKKIVISMEKLRFIDSSGLAMLVNLLHECKRLGVKLKLTNLSGEAEKTLTLTKLLSSFEITANLEEAIYSLK